MRTFVSSLLALLLAVVSQYESAPTPETSFTVLVFANENTVGSLKIALCTWMPRIPPGDIIIAGDFDEELIKGITNSA
jgi:hypothetical protein